jgi:ubiquinone/menaquinone biosynthesis C-methylase UbiE
MPDLDAIYADLWTAHGDELAVLDESLRPRSWQFLFEMVRAARVGASSIVADIGCGRGNHSVELARRFGCRAIGIDLVLPPLQIASKREDASPEVEFVQGEIECLPLRSASVDFIWCRDMLVHVRDLDAAARECARILRPGGSMLAWVTVETDLMEPLESERIYTPLAIERGSLSAQNLEASFQAAGFAIARKEEMGSELIEHYEEKDGRASRELMRLARMRRAGDRFIAELGRTRYDAVSALYHWVIYHLLGKLSSGYYLLRTPGRRK